MHLIALVIAVLELEAMAEPTARSIELLPSSRNPASALILPSANGFDVFWSQLRGKVGANFDLFHAQITSDGQLVDTPVAILPHAPRHVAAGEADTFGVTYQQLIGNDYHGHVTAIRNNKVMWDVAIPSRHTHGTMAIRWDPVARLWVVIGEESGGGNRLFFLRLDERGRWKTRPTYITDEKQSALISDWGNPMIWAGDRFAIVWSAHPGGVVITELAGTKVTHIPVTTAKGLGRGVMAWTKSGYVVAGREDDTRRRRRIFVATVHDGVADPVRYMSSPDWSASEVMIASDGTRVAVAFHEDMVVVEPLDRRKVVNFGSAVRAVIVNGQTMTSVARSSPRDKQHDWVQSIAWNGREFGLLHTNGINPSSVQLVLFQ
jgi:hypothetical protein